MAAQESQNQRQTTLRAPSHSRLLSLGQQCFLRFECLVDAIISHGVEITTKERKFPTTLVLCGRNSESRKFPESSARVDIAALRGEQKSLDYCNLYGYVSTTIDEVYA